MGRKGMLELQAEDRQGYWQELLGEELRQRLIEEAHADIPAVRLELKRIGDKYRGRTGKARKAVAGGG